ncbi:hypothetical protein ACNKU7_12660 [Microbulbifer sp. SA54]|uniref:DUF7919 family protein n=1 Tax=Microbulbifer sp. SA54 TaxID=3401577 RepID=UPI003AB010D0
MNKIFQSGGIFVHPSNHKKIASFDAGLLFSEVELVSKEGFVDNLWFLYQKGRSVNVRRHLAYLELAGGKMELCELFFSKNGVETKEQLTDCEILAENDSGVTFYAHSSIIYAVQKYGYKPPDQFIDAVKDEVIRLRNANR